MMGWWRWFSLRAGHRRPTISDHIAEGCQSILIAKMNIGNCVVWRSRFHDGSRLVVWECPNFKVPALVNRMIGSCIKPLPHESNNSVVERDPAGLVDGVVPLDGLDLGVEVGVPVPGAGDLAELVTDSSSSVLVDTAPAGVLL